MKPLALILTAVTTSALTAGLFVVLNKPAAVEGHTVADQVSSEAVDQLSARLNAQEELLRDISTKLELRSPRRAEPARQEDLESVVRKVMASEQAKLAADAVTTSADKFNITRAHDQFLRLQAAGASDSEIAAFWEDIRTRGKIDDVLASFEEYALANPNDVIAQVELGNAYLQRLQDAKNGPEMGIWATKADEAFDDALELDESNWEARFSKAISLSFWPPIFGKQGEAISQFETLLEQQARVTPEDNHAQTYMFLGNLYQQQGNNSKAESVWLQGNAAFPNDEALAEKLANSTSN
ncbi:MAG: tetratricopeptide (TPR) repeat protein [Planctomycetota bacterium]|jgi:tetratricopeptide (TPR) repeat protein